MYKKILIPLDRSFGAEAGGNEMTLNVGGADRFLRIVVGIVLLALVVVGPKTWWGLLGVIPLATGLVSY